MENVLQAVLERARNGVTFQRSTSAERNPCPFDACDGSGWIMREREDAQPLATPCRCLAQREQARKLEQLFGQARIPRRYLGRMLDHLDASRHPAAMRAARAFVEEWEQVQAEGRWLFLSGPVGTGKTALAYAVLQELLARGAVGLAETVPELMDHLRPGRDARAEERLELCKTVDLLVLDDIGAQRTTDWVTERLFVILDARYRDQRPTILTSNCHVEELEQLPGWQRITDRIVEAAVLVRMDGESHRFEAAKRRLEEGRR